MNCCNNNKTSSTEPPKENLLDNKKIRWLIGAFLLILPFEILSFFSIHFSIWVKAPLSLLMILVIGRKVIVDGIKSMFTLRFSDINLLMTVAISGAIYLYQFEEAVIIVVLFTLSEAMEDYGVTQSKKALEDLVNRTPKTALIKGQSEKTVIDDIDINTIIIIKPGDIIPLDGVIVAGNSFLDEAMITGEPLPKQKFTGDSVYAGSHNSQGYLEIKVTKSSKDTTLAKIIELTYEAAEKKSHSQKFIESFAKFYTPAVVLTATLIVIIPVFAFDKEFNFWLVQAITVLIISCPCALVISTPVTVFSAIGNATRRGVLIKGGKFLEELAKAKAIAFDKTRTLTKGEPQVSDVFAYNEFSTDEVLACAAGLELFSEHPIAKSIIAKAEDANLEPHKFCNFRAVAGKGVEGECLICDNPSHYLGNLQFVSDRSDGSVEQYVKDRVSKLESEGKTSIVISEQKMVKGIIGITDKIRTESAKMIENISTLGLTPVMLTGDNKKPAVFVANQLGIKDVRAELLPEQKDEEIRKMTEQFGHVIMVGDGVNDAPALARSSVGIAIGAVGSDLAVENADIALMNDNIALIPYLISLGRKCSAKIRLNILSSVGVKAIFLILAILGYSSIAWAIFADVGMTMIVVLNGLSLFRFKYET